MKNLLILLIFLSACATKSLPKNIVFVGTYTQNLGWVDGKASGIYACDFDDEKGTLTVLDSTIGIKNPSFLTISPDKKYLYAIGENAPKGEKPYGEAIAYKITEGYKLLKINQLPSYGAHPCHIATDKTGKMVFLANYSSGNVTSYSVNADGSLKDSTSTRLHEGSKPNAHQIFTTPDNKTVFAVDKGADKVFMYSVGEKGELILKNKVSTAVGAGPRHADFNPKNPSQFALINELNNSITTYNFDDKTLKTNGLDSLSTLPTDFKGNNTTAEIFYHPNGKYIYGSNRGHNSIAIFKVDEKGKLTAIGHAPTQGSKPRSFMITPNGKWLLAANQDSDNVAIFQIDAQTGLLTLKNVSRVLTPVCLKML
jgi:6-phosphogluconolactonase